MMFQKTALLAGTIFIIGQAAAYPQTPDLPSCDEWAPACSANYTASSRPDSYPIQYVVIHTRPGSAASVVAWYQNCSAGQSSHYVFSALTGYCYQCVRESDIAWHTTNWAYDTQSMGLDHCGIAFSGGISTRCYNESAVEARACILYYSVLHDRQHIIGASEVPGSTETGPGPLWNWKYYMQRCDPAPQTIMNDDPIVSNNWFLMPNANPTEYKYYGHTTGPVSDPAIWTSFLPGSGTYAIYVMWTQGSNRSASAAYTLPNGMTIHKNQQTSGGQWVSLGTVSLPAGDNSVMLSPWAPPGYIVVAGPLRFYGPM